MKHCFQWSKLRGCSWRVKGHHGGLTVPNFGQDERRKVVRVRGLI